MRGGPSARQRFLPSACARVCSDLKRATMARSEIGQDAARHALLSISPARISSQRTSLDSTWTALGGTVRIEQSLRNFPRHPPPSPSPPAVFDDASAAAARAHCDRLLDRRRKRDIEATNYEMSDAALVARHPLPFEVLRAAFLTSVERVLTPHDHRRFADATGTEPRALLAAMNRTRTSDAAKAELLRVCSDQAFVYSEHNRL
eukprot:CAMPEP_0185340420 /NCGR_PEP_ID=MMETSP1363-20130426/98115_1 /TAXON_ID=38817 /ORGANISM="Gephyrocapsa oceanica, Strain RCC1303" /LENGTH=203 /DNA_ID=CAMNT_0027939647 /DNA_START=1175 /DNA_END=1784 /DNA_ORIENTATION=+